MRVVSFKADDRLLFLLEEVSRRRSMSKSEIIRRALRRYIESDAWREPEPAPVVTRRMRVW